MAEEYADDSKLGKDEESSAKTNDELVKRSKQGPRKRVSQACDRCRSRKDKCDGKKPACSTCTTNGRACSYDANVKKRGLPEGYVRGLEKLWGLAIREVDTIEDNILVTLGGDEDSHESPLSIWNDESNSEALVEIWRKSHISRELERLLSSQEPSFEGKRRRIDPPNVQAEKDNTEVDGLLHSAEAFRNDMNQGWVDSAFDIGQPSRFQNSPPPPKVDETRIIHSRGFESILSPSHGASSTPGTIVDFPDLPSETWHLLDVYFSYTHPWLPIIEKHDLLRTSYQYSQNRGNASLFGSGSGESAILWAVIAYAKFQHRAINNIPHALGPIGEMVWTAERMYARARSLIPNEEGTLELGHVQALLILALANMGMDLYSRAWSLVGQAVRAAIDLQLDRPLDQSKAKSRSKHVFLGCFVLDTLIAARLSRRPHLRTDDLEHVGSIDEDGLEEWDPWTDCLSVRRNSSSSRVPASILSTFNQLVQVLGILNELTCSTGSSSFQASSLSEKLRVWSQSQSSPLQYDPSVMNSEPALSLLPHQYHLNTTYFATLAALQLLSQGRENDSGNLEPCTRSGRRMAELLTQHSNTFGLLIVPPTYETFVKTAYDIVSAVHGSIDNTHIVLNDWRRSLDICLDAMGPAWPVFESFKSSISYESIAQPRRESQVAYDLISGIQDSETPLSSKTPQSMASYETMYSPQTYRPQTRDQPVAPNSSTKFGAQTVQHRTTSFGQSSGQGLPLNPLNIYENSHATFGSNSRQPSQTQKPLIKDVQQLAARQPLINLPQSGNQRLQRSMTMSSGDIEFDPMFNELMRLDATEWTGNWDQSLMNLGFAENDNMDQDFYAFCQEPDPLHPNNVFQQLVANSNAEAIDFFDGSGFNMGMSGFGGLSMDMDMGLGDENEGIEAGQILQALSAAEDQRASGALNG